MSLNNQDDMSMEEILASIRQYVSTTNDRPQNDNTAKVIKLTEDYLVEADDEVQAPRIVETATKSRPSSPFSKLQEVKKASDKDAVFMQFFRDIVFEWLDQHPEFVEKAMNKAIKKALDD